MSQVSLAPARIDIDSVTSQMQSMWITGPGRGEKKRSREDWRLFEIVLTCEIVDVNLASNCLVMEDV